MSDLAIQTHELGKRYTLGLSKRGYGTLREALVDAAQRPFKRKRDEQAGAAPTNSGP